MNSKILKTKNTLREALFALISKKDLNEITVSELCAKARINRTTFYKYFALPADVLREYFIEINDSVLGQINITYSSSMREDTYAKMLHICKVYYENRKIMKIYVSNMQDIMTMMTSVISKNPVGGLRENSLIYFLAGGVAALILQWAQSGFALTPQEISTILTDYICRLQPG